MVLAINVANRYDLLLIGFYTAVIALNGNVILELGDQVNTGLALQIPKVREIQKRFINA